ncbi:hypothetical protein [Streptomyces sp. NPDC020983]|uniref:hypothetical protein n=1 Tax=Streptomyces sp. NPDC020983 TaxID=3365106 RepID=UPI00378B1E53
MVRTGPSPAPGAPPPAGGERAEMLVRLNLAVRRPAAYGGLTAVARLLDALAQAGPEGGDAVWIPDTTARLASSGFLREAFPRPQVHVVASQYGEDAHRRGWLRLDRTLTAGEHAVLAGKAVGWADSDRTLHEVTGEFGPPSAVFGPGDPDLPKTLGYATADRAAPFVAFHFGAARAGADGAALLAVRVHDGFVDGWTVTPWGEGLLV